MQVFVVSGFLGAGKTTFIQTLAARCGRDFVVYENEYAQADLDARTLAASEQISVWESTENCICCSGKQDFAASVLTIANTLDPDFLVVEPTGVARLSSVLENVAQVSYERISLLPSVVVVDALNWREELRTSEAIFMDQVTSAPTIVVSKSQLAPLGEVEELVAWLAEHAPAAQVVQDNWEELDASWFLGLLQQGTIQVAPSSASAAANGTAVAGADSDPDFERLSLSHVSLPSESHLLWFMDALVAGVFGKIQRAKGVLWCGGQMLRFDVVGTQWQVSGAVDEGQQLGQDEKEVGASQDSVAIFIGHELRKSWLREVLIPEIRALVEQGQHVEADSEAFDITHDHNHEHGHEHKHTSEAHEA